MNRRPDSNQRPPAGPLLTRFLPPYLIYQLRARPLAYLAEIEQRYDLARLGWAGAPVFYAASPDLVKELLFDPRVFIKGRILRRLEVIIGKGLITLNGEPWRDARRRVQEVFHRHFLLRQQEVVIRHTQHTIERLRDRAAEGPINLDRVMNELTFAIAMELFVGASIESPEESARLQWAIDELNAYAKWRTWSVISEKWNTPRNRRFHQALGMLERLVEGVLEKRKREHAASRSERCDVLSLLLDAGFDDRQLRDHLMTMLIAGHETTGTALAFLWAHVARRGDVQDALYAESCSQPAGEAALDELPFAEAVWKEILRLYPSVPVLDRESTEDTRLGDYSIPAGANILWSPYVLHRTARHWPHRDDLDAFEPWAFMKHSTPRPGVYIPFGQGPRMCLGKALADMEALTIVSLLVRAFEIRSAVGGPVEMQTLVTLRPLGGVPVYLTPRTGDTHDADSDQTAELIGC